jgi:hypothetical protein
MHCQANTLDGAFGFQATLADGSVVREFESLWDEVPQGVDVARLELVNAAGEVLAQLPSSLSSAAGGSAAKAQSFYFGNEAVSVSSFRAQADGSLAGASRGEPLLVGKFIGGVYGGIAVELRLNPGNGCVDIRNVPAQDLRFSPGTYRRAEAGSLPGGSTSAAL